MSLYYCYGQVVICTYLVVCYITFVVDRSYVICNGSICVRIKVRQFMTANIYIQVPPLVQDKAIIVTVLLQLLYNVFVLPRVINITVFILITLFLLHTCKTNMLCNQLALP